MNDVQAENHKKIKHVMNLLPMYVSDAVMGYHINNPEVVINEIRLRKDREIMLNISFSEKCGVSKKLGVILSGDSISSSVTGLCRGSVYSHTETIREGYINCGYGIRAGICGRAVVESGKVISVTDFTSINIRIPNEISGAGYAADELIRKFGSILVCSSPGEGKTTILRDLSVRLSGGVRYNPPLRVAVVDTRYELQSYSDIPSALELDVLSGYPRSVGIDIAARTMSPDVIICDEISSDKDAEAVKAAAASGIYTAASAHAGSFDEFRMKKSIFNLWQSGAIMILMFIRRNKKDSENIHINKRDADNLRSVSFSDENYRYTVVFSEFISNEAFIAYSDLHSGRYGKEMVFEL